ncbi:MAG TPA: phosphatase PAP2 family protein [Stellaceae bacterium]|nr:phosphatase PAP2 family protein [Stellaceae bacterium]
MASPFLYAVTDFGSTAVLIPVTAVVLVWLLFQPTRDLAAWWLVAATACIIGTAALKIWFFVCPDPDLHSPSGHTSLSALVYGALTMIGAAYSEGWRRRLAVGLSVLAVLSIALSRVLLGAHTAVETGLGVVIGLAALAIFLRAHSAMRPKFVHVRPLFLCVALLVLLLHGQQLHAEELLQSLGVYIKAGGVACG